MNLIDEQSTGDNDASIDNSPSCVTAKSAIAALQDAAMKIDWESLLKSGELVSMLNIGPTMKL